MSLQKMLPFLFINVIVSLVTVLVVMTLWNRQDRPSAASPAAATAAPTLVAVAPGGGGAPADAAAPTAEPGGDAPAEAAPSSPEATATPTVHTVAAGDSLGGIALRYEVGVTDIVRANGLDNPDQIFVGQQLIIPIGGFVEPTPEPTTPPTPLPTIDVQTGVSTVAIGGVRGGGDPAAEGLEIVNTGPNPIDLTGWTVSDEAGLRYTFPEGVLYGDGAGVTLFTRGGADNALERYWGLASAVWTSGKTAVLRDAAGAIQASYSVP